jgi:putative SOS response-associated peptidase YedK
MAGVPIDRRSQNGCKRTTPSVIDDSYYAPSYNVAPQSTQPVVRLDSETVQRELTVMRWGLVPF